MSVFRHVDTGDGLSSDTVHSLYQDRRGFVWISTDDGLNRYDGHSVRVYRHDPTEPTSIAGNYVTAVVEDREGYLWVSFGIGGVDRLDPDTGIAQHFEQAADSTGLSHQIVHGLLEDRDGVLWIATEEGSDRFVSGDRPHFQRDFALRGRTLDLAEDGAGRLWAATEHGLFYKDERGTFGAAPIAPEVIFELVPEPEGNAVWGIVRGGGLIRVGDSLQVRRYPTSSEITAIGATDRDPREDRTERTDSIWLLTSRGELLRLDPETGSLEGYLTGREGEEGARARCIHADSTLLAVGTHEGLAIYDRVADRFRIYRHDPADPSSLGHDQVMTLLRDRTGILWIGTGKGVDLWNERAMRFPHYRLPDEREVSAEGELAVSILEAPSGALWIGTGNGLGVLDSSGKWTRHLASAVDGPSASGDRASSSSDERSRSGDGASSSSDERSRSGDRASSSSDERSRSGDGASHSGSVITSLCRSADGSIWVGTNMGFEKRSGLDASRTTISIPVPNGGVRCLAEDRRGNLWVGTGWGLFRRDGETGSIEAFQVTGDQYGLPAATVRVILEDRAGILWIGTYIGGLSRLDPVTERFTHYVYAPDDPRTPNNKSITDLFEDSKGRLWVGTYSGGLNLFDRATETFTYYTTREGLPGNKVDGILEDAGGRLWIATNQGMSCFDPETETFRNYDASDGLQSDRFSIGSRVRMQSGELVFGGSNGFNCFHPEDLAFNPVPPTIAMTSFRLFDQEVPLSQTRLAEGLQLGPKDDFFSFEFAALDFGNPERNQYAYRLDGFDSDWIHSGTRHYAAYTNLDPGRYTLRVKAANSDGVWNEAGISIPIHIRPPFYQTWWFYLMSALSVGSIAWLLHHLRVRQQIAQSMTVERMRMSERERVREQISRDYHDALGHKITKITLFSALAERNLGSSDHPAVPYLRKVFEAAQDLSRETRGFIWMLSPSKDLLYEVASHLHDFGTNLFADTLVQVEVIGLSEPLRAIRVSVEWKRDVTLLFREALHNSLKHSNCENVRLEFGLTCGPEYEASNGNGSMPGGSTGIARIELTDDGLGFGASPGSNGGNGLENMTRRARAIGGRLEIESTSTGTRIRLDCPIEEDPQNRGVWRPAHPVGLSLS